MAKITITKFIDDQEETSFTIPAMALQLINTLLPEYGIDQLAAKGLDTEAILEAHKTKTAYTASIQIVEGGVAKTVVITVS